MKREISILLIGFLLFGCSNKSSRTSNNISDVIYNGAFLGSTKLINEKINKGLDINNQYVQEKTLLIEAVRSNNMDTASELLKLGADIEKRDLHGRTAIFYSSSLEILKLLISHNAEMNIIDNNGVSLMNYFVENKPPEYSYLLIDSGLYSKKINVNLKDEKLGFLLVEKDNKEIIDRIIRINPDIFQSKDKNGNYPIFYGKSSEVILSLLDIDYNLQEKNNYGEIILGEVYLKAVRNNELNIIKKIIRKGVNPKYHSYGETPLNIAKKNGNKAIIEYLNGISAK